MQPYGSFNPMAPYFQTARETAANIPQPGERGTYLKEMFQEDFPQFCQLYTQSGSDEEPVKLLLPETMLQTFIDQANDSVLPSRWGSLWRYAAGLYVAHFSALYLKTTPLAPETPPRRLERRPRWEWSKKLQWGILRSATTTAP